MLNNHDYIVIGSTGFAQVGQNDYYDKNLIEKKVLMEFMEDKYPMPPSFSSIAAIYWKSFSHEAGQYHELCVLYYPDIVDSWKDENIEQYDLFWNWVNSMENEDLETEELLNKMQEIYIKENPMHIVYKQNVKLKKTS